MGSAVRMSAPQRRAQIFEAAQALALREGLGALTHRAAASEAGVTAALVAKHFDDIDALRAEVFASAIGQESRSLLSRAAESGTALGGLRSLIVDLAVLGRGVHAAMWLDGWSRGRTSPIIARAVREEMEFWQTSLAQLIADGVGAGEFSVDDPDACAWEFIALLDGLSAHGVVGYRPDADRVRILAAPLAARLGIPIEELESAGTHRD